MLASCQGCSAVGGPVSSPGRDACEPVIIIIIIVADEIEIHASPEAVFDELSDQRHEMRWSPKMRSVESISGEPIRVVY